MSSRRSLKWIPTATPNRRCCARSECAACRVPSGRCRDASRNVYTCAPKDCGTARLHKCWESGFPVSPNPCSGPLRLSRGRAMHNLRGNCLTELRLLQALDEELPLSEVWLVKLHLESCASCQARLDELQLVSFRVSELHQL